MCGKGIEIWEHVWEGCRNWKEGREGSWQEELERILGDEGEGWIRELEKERKRGERREKGYEQE